MKRNRRNIAVALGLLIVISLLLLLAVLVPYRPVWVAGPKIESVRLSLAEPIQGLRLYVFNTGANRMSSLLVGPLPPWRAVPAFVIEHPNGGLVVFDLGLSHEVAEHGEKAISPPVGWLMESRGRPGLTLEAQMKEAGLSPSDVEYVVISHLHEDHTGVADEFAQAIFIAGPGTRERATEGRHSPFHSGKRPEWQEADFEGEGVVEGLGPFDSGIDLFGDGSILLISGGAGHTSEDLMMLVNLPSGPVLLTGDAVVHFDWLESEDVERIASDPERAAVLRNQVRSLHESDDARDERAVLVIPGHDLRRLGRGRPDLIHHHPERFKSSAWPIERE